MGANHEMLARGCKFACKGIPWGSLPLSTWDCTCTDKVSRKYFKLKVQSAIFICIFMLLFTVLLFVLCTLDPGVLSEKPWISPPDSKRTSTTWSMLRRSRFEQALALTKEGELEWDGYQDRLALQGMGVLFRRGSRGMHDLFVAHLGEATSPEELQFFLRTLHRSGMPARSDVVILFPWSPVPKEFVEVIRAEERSFRHLVRQAESSFQVQGSSQDGEGDKQVQSGGEDGNSEVFGGKAVPSFGSSLAGIETFGSGSGGLNASVSVFNFLGYRKSAEENRGPVEPSLWGNGSNFDRQETPRWAEWGSIVGFEMQDLDPTEMLKGFIDKPTSQLRRWVCYQMILGMVRPRYRNVVLSQVAGVTFLGDALASVRKREGLYLAMEDRKWSEAPAAREETLLEARQNVARLSEQEGEDHGESDERPDDAEADHAVTDWSDVGERKLLEAGRGVSRRRRGSRKRPKKAGTAGLLEEVYGKQLWKSLDKEEKEKDVVSSEILMGGIRPIRTLTNAMVTEIVRVALQRKNRHFFHDKALINYLVHKSPVLGRRVLDHLKLMKNEDGVIHVLPGSRQQKPFHRARGAPFVALVGHRHGGQQLLISELVHQDICHSPSDAEAYPDCSPIP